MIDHGNDIRHDVHALRTAVSRALERQAQPLRDRSAALCLDLPEPINDAAYIARIADDGDPDAADELIAEEAAYDHAVRLAQINEAAHNLLAKRIHEVLHVEDRQLAHIETNAEAALRVANQIAQIKLANRDPGIVQSTLDATAGTASKTARQLAEKYGCTAEAEQLALDLQELLAATSQVRRVG